MTYLFLDTNSYIQYQDFEFIKWEEICNDKDYIIAVTGIALREIDKHKDSSRGKLQNRAKRCGKKINQILRGKVNSKVKLQHVGDPNTKTFSSPLFNKDINDDWLVHTAKDFNANGNRKVIISNDYNVYTRALGFDIETIEIPEMYLLPSETTDEERKIKELESRLKLYENSVSNPQLRFLNGESEIHLKISELPNFENRKDEILLELKSKYPQRELPTNNLRSYLLVPPDLSCFNMTQEDVDNYNNLLPNFYEKESQYLYLKEAVNAVNERIIPLRFEICNLGHAPTGVITIELSFSENAKVLTDDNRINYQFDRVDTPVFTSAFARKLNLPKFDFSHPDNTLYSWDTGKTNSGKTYVFDLYKPVLHNVKAEEIIENEFYIFIANPQCFEIKWAIADSSLPEKIFGTLKVIVE